MSHPMYIQGEVVIAATGVQMNLSPSSLMIRVTLCYIVTNRYIQWDLVSHIMHQSTVTAIKHRYTAQNENQEKYCNNHLSNS